MLFPQTTQKTVYTNRRIASTGKEMNKLSSNTRFNANNKVFTELWSTKHKVLNLFDELML